MQGTRGRDSTKCLFRLASSRQISGAARMVGLKTFVIEEMPVLIKDFAQMPERFNV